MKTAEYLKTSKVYTKRLRLLKKKVADEDIRGKTATETADKKIASRKNTLKILTNEKTVLVKDISDLKSEKEEGEKTNEGLQVSIKSNEGDLESSIEKRDVAAKQLVEVEEKVKSYEPVIVNLKDKQKREEEKLDKLTKKRISAAQEQEVLDQMKEEIKYAYNKAGMTSPL